jgi:hypothetical protein
MPQILPKKMPVQVRARSAGLERRPADVGHILPITQHVLWIGAFLNRDGS